MEKRGIRNHQRFGQVIIIIILLAVFSLIITISQKNDSSILGLTIYNIGNFDYPNYTITWTEGGNNNNGSYTYDTQTYFTGIGSIKGSTIPGEGINWSNNYLSQILPIDSPPQSPIYINFYWKKGYEYTTPQNHNMYMILERPDNSKIVIWNNNQQIFDTWTQESINMVNKFTQYGQYKLRLGCDVLMQQNATNNSRSSCWFDEIVLDLQNDTQGGGGVAPTFYSLSEIPDNNTFYSTTTTYEFRVSTSGSDGKIWIDLDNSNRTMSQYSGNIYRYLIPNLTAGTHTFYYWTWGASQPKIKNSTEKRYYTIKKAQGEVKTIIHGVRGNVELFNNSYICISINTPDGSDGTKTLYLDGKIYGQSNYDFQNCTLLNKLQTINVSTYWDGGSNYLSDWEGWNINVTNEKIIQSSNNSIIKIVSPENKTYKSGTESINLILSSTTTLKECSYSLDGLELKILDKINNTYFSKLETKISEKNSHQVFFVCKDLSDNTYNVQPIINFNVENKTIKQETIKQNDSKKDDEILINESITCYPSWKCTDWSDCSQISYDVNDVIKGKINVTGERKRICYDLRLCKNAKIEREYCDISIPIETKTKELCGEEYLEVYDKNTNKLVSRIKGHNFGNRKKVDIGFIVGETNEYCNYCYNDIKDYDETGIDCGGSCNTCQISEYNKLFSGNQIKLALTLIEVVIISIILFLMFWWLILKRMWKENIFEGKSDESKEAVEIIKNALYKGYSEEQIKSLFRKKNWSELQIDELIRKAKN